MTPKKAIERLRLAHAESWMADRGFVDRLDRTVRERQRHLLGQEALRRRRAPPRDHAKLAPFSVEILAYELRWAVTMLDEGRSGPMRVSIACALLGELIAAALCRDGDAAGKTYPKLGDPEWLGVHRPMSVFRNAVLHPGAVLPAPDAETVSVGMHVGLLAQILEKGTGRDRGSDFKFLARALSEAPGEILSEAMALWAVLQVNALGRFDAARVGMRPSGG